jgi:cyclase
MISGPVSNALVQVGLDGVLLVDTGRGEDAAGLLAQVRRLSPRPIRYLLNTNPDADHVGGNAALSGTGTDIGSGNERPDGVQGYGATPTLAHEQVMFQLLEQGASEGLPTLTYFVAQKDIFFNGEPVSLIHAPGHTGGDSLVMFRRSDVIAAGDIYTPDRYPDLALDKGGSITAYLASLNHLIALTVPEFNQQGGTFVVPGHGRLSDEGDIQDYRDMVTFIRDRVKAMVDQGMSLAQVLAARPSQDYDVRYSRAAGDRFVGQVYASLTAPPADDAAALEVPE